MKLHRGVLQAFRGDAAAARQTLQPLLRQQIAAPMAPRNPFAPKKKATTAPQPPQQMTVVPPQVGPDDLPELGLAYYLVGEKDAALRLWEQLFKSNDRGLLTARALLYRANVHLHTHHYQAALDDLGMAQNIMPNNPQLHYLLYAVHRILNNKDNADYHLQKAISLGHTSAAAGRDGDVPQLFPAPSLETPEPPHA
jgi:tetratricopeptide (TPR) repeat protein